MSDKKPPIRMHIGLMIRRDMPKILRIETTSYDYPWCEDDFLRCLRSGNCVGMALEPCVTKGIDACRRQNNFLHWLIPYDESVAAVDEQVLGFMIYEPHKTKLRILNFAVHPECRRHGFGARMVDTLINKLSSHRRTRLVIEVRETNMGALFFLRAMEFHATKVSHEFYDDTGEDVFVMEYRLGGWPDDNKRLPKKDRVPEKEFQRIMTKLG